MALHEYRRKRSFRVTPEPKGKVQRGRRGKPIFVIQEHDATSLHYDFRLEVGGVLKSWAVPKGPSTDPREKRLAVQTEDHPLAYARFEGVIPEGEYGAGAVIVWDRGTYDNIRKKNGRTVPMPKALKEGQVEVFLRGRKLTGGYALHKFLGEKRNWLLVKMNDAGADARRNPIRTEPRSVRSGKTLKQIARSKS